MRQKKRTAYTEIELLEGSGDGIPAYPDAHNSFIKSLSEVKMEEETKTMELTPEVEIKEETVEVKKEEVIENKLVDELQKQTELAKEAKKQLEFELAEIKKIKQDIVNELNNVEEMKGVKNQGLAETKKQVEETKKEIKYEKGNDNEFFQDVGKALEPYFKIN